jgi:hypothetical protein
MASLTRLDSIWPELLEAEAPASSPAQLTVLKSNQQPHPQLSEGQAGWT